MKIIECPRDAMQGISEFIPTNKKIAYINQLLKIGFHTIDFGSFVSPKVIPQLKDTAKVLSALDLSNSSSKLLSIIANKRGAYQACEFEEIDYLGFPLSVSEQFQKRNTNKTIEEAINDIEDIQDLSINKNKQMVIYLSMAFGNPYGEYYDIDLVVNLAERLSNLDIGIIALADTTGISESNNIGTLFSTLVDRYPTIEFGAHFHTTRNNFQEKLDAAYNNGCIRFDTTIKGYGGCPMADSKLVGNMPTEDLLLFLKEKGLEPNIREDLLFDIVKKMSIYF